MIEGRIIKVSGPLVVAAGMRGAKMYDVVKVGSKKLIGEIIELKEDKASIQVYEETSGIGPGEVVVSTEEPLSVELGPGLLGSIYDGIQRPLDVIRRQGGDYILRGVDIPGIDREKRWHFKPLAKTGDIVSSGDIVGEVQETTAIVHKILVPVGINGKIVKIQEGDFNVLEVICSIETKEGDVSITMLQKWPVRKSRPIKERLEPIEPLITGQRVIDTLFPVAKGGTACIPGPFGSGKTVVEHTLAKWCDADIVVYVAAGERGNEVADLLIEMPELKDPRTGQSLMQRTIIIANTSNMPVAAREASIYTGMTLAEYYRDMGYSVAVMADSTSRWAEALREISGRLEEMPGEEGYPAYLSYRIAEFYERAGRVSCVGSKYREGALSVVGAISPPGGDLSDPVVQATLRIVKVFWSLEDKLAYARHFPAINWLSSYSLYIRDLEKFFMERISSDFLNIRAEAMRLLQEEASLLEIARLVGIESLSHQDRLILEVARSIREDFLHQHAFHEIDTYSSLMKQYKLLKLIIQFYEQAKALIEEGTPIHKILSLSARQDIARAKYILEDNIMEFDKISDSIKEQVGFLSRQIGS
ncbi:MAG: V-type ATP synthase subunit A [Candidatus Omnitrophica bacterium]|nr:V-type ATP synthase subunit A [Candidatus Omnitrophota bacterium]